MEYDIMTIGIPMVEFTKKQLDSPLSEYGEFSGPFAAGDPGIALNACVTLGYTGCYVGVAGQDAFADCFLRRLKKSGIDTSYIRRDTRSATGISMLTRFSDGSRSFIFTLPDSAAAKLGPDDLSEELICHVKWIHLSGFAISISDSISMLHHKLIEKVDDDVQISFDPNYRREIIVAEDYKNRCAPVFERCDLFLPSCGEAGLFCEEAENEVDACRQIAAGGKLVALKDGANGCYAFDGGREMHIPAFPVEEVDPTGAGDTFGGALIAALMDGKGFFDAARYGAAAGGVAVGRMGLLDDAPSRADIQDILDA